MDISSYYITKDSSVKVIGIFLNKKIEVITKKKK